MSTNELLIARRQLLKGTATGAFVLAIGLDGEVRAAEPPKYGAASMPGGTVEDPLVFVSIAPDGTVTIVAHRAEMGTGVRTSLPMVVADEMEARWERVKIVQAPADEARYGNQNVDGSRSMRHFFQPMRRVGAAARQMLEAAAAARWGVPISEVRAAKHEVLHTPTGRRLGYGELAADAARQPVPATTALRLKTPDQWTYIGKGRIGGTDLDAIARGRATFGMDALLPGMVFAVVARPPVVDGKLKRVDSIEALKVAGVIKVVEIAAFQGPAAFQPLGGVAVVARNTWAAMQGRAALKLEWDDGANATYDSAAFRRVQAEAVKSPGTVFRNDGDAPKALAAALPQRRHTAEYFVPHLAHATMEPPVATALVNDQGCEIWTSTQNPQAALGGVAGCAGFEARAGEGERAAARRRLRPQVQARLRDRSGAGREGHARYAGEAGVDTRRRHPPWLLPRRLARPTGGRRRRRRLARRLATPHRGADDHIALRAGRQGALAVRARHVGDAHAVRRAERAHRTCRGGGACAHRLVPLGGEHPARVRDTELQSPNSRTAPGATRCSTRSR